MNKTKTKKGLVIFFLLIGMNIGGMHEAKAWGINFGAGFEAIINAMKAVEESRNAIAEANAIAERAAAKAIADAKAAAEKKAREAAAAAKKAAADKALVAAAENRAKAINTNSCSKSKPRKPSSLSRIFGGSSRYASQMNQWSQFCSSEAQKRATAERAARESAVKAAAEKKAREAAAAAKKAAADKALVAAAEKKAQAVNTNSCSKSKPRKPSSLSRIFGGSSKYASEMNQWSQFCSNESRQRAAAERAARESAAKAAAAKKAREAAAARAAAVKKAREAAAARAAVSRAATAERNRKNKLAYEVEKVDNARIVNMEKINETVELKKERKAKERQFKKEMRNRKLEKNEEKAILEAAALENAYFPRVSR